MVDAVVQITAGTGTKVQVFENTIGANVVEAQAVSLVTPAGLAVGTSANPLAVWDPDALATGTITTTDIVVTAPAGDGTVRTGASTAGSLVALACPGGDSAWIMQITGLTSGTLYFEGSIDSTNGTDGTWININGRQTGIVNTVLAGNSTVNGVYRGNTSGLNYYRVRSVGTLTGTPAIRIRISAGTGAIFLNASVPAGSNVIGGVTQSGTWNSTINAALPTGANVIGAVTQSGTWNIGSIAALPALATGANTIGTVNQGAITKGTQGATGVTTQDLKDAGRTRVTVLFQGTAPATADTLLTLVKTSAGVAAAGATSIGVTSAKTLRITAISFSLKLGAAAAGFATMTLRSNPAGATVIGSQSEFRADVGNAAATIGASDQYSIAIPDGMEFSGTQTIGISLAAQAITNVVSISLLGFEY